MIYPVYVHMGDDDHAHGAIIPDFSGCFSAADELAELPLKIQEAVELYCEGEDMDLPQPSNIEDYEGNDEFEGGTWMLIDIDLRKLNTKAVRLNVTLPQNLLKEIDLYAESHHLSRSALLAKAASEMLSKH